MKITAEYIQQVSIIDISICAPALVVILIEREIFFYLFICIWLDNLSCDLIFFATLPFSYAKKEDSFWNYWKILIKYKGEVHVRLGICADRALPSVKISKSGPVDPEIPNWVRKAGKPATAVVWVNPVNRLKYVRPLIQTIGERYQKNSGIQDQSTRSLKNLI